MKNYLNYLMHKKLLQTIILAMIPTFIMMVTISVYDFEGYYWTSYQDPLIFNLSTVMMMIVLAFIVIFRFGSLRNQKEVDLYYALPISRKDLFLTHYLFGLIQAFIIWTSIFFLSLITLFIKTQVYEIGWFFLLYIVVSFYIVITYTIATFTFMRARTIIDGIVFILLFHLTFLILSLALIDIKYLNNSDIWFMFEPFYALNQFGTIFMEQANPFNDNPMLFTDYASYMIVNMVIFITAAVFMFKYDIKNMTEQKVEYIGDISSSKLGYELYIPALLFLISFATFYFSQLISLLILIILTSVGFIGFFIYRRSFKIKRQDLLYIFIPIVVGIFFSLIFH